MQGQASQDPQALARESSRIGVNLIALVGSRFISMALALVQSAIIFRALSVEGTGQFGFAFGYTSLFTVFATLGIHRLLMRDIARNYDIAWTYVWTALTVVIVLSALVFAVIAGSMCLVEDNPQVRNAVMMAALWVVVLWALQSPLEGLLMAKERMVLVAVVYVVGAVLRLASVYLLLQRAETSVAAHGAIVLANLAALLLCFVFCIVAAGWERPQLRLRLALAQVRECVPFMAAMICSLVYFKSDISLLKFILGEEAAGLYTPTIRVTEPIMMIAGLWGTAVFPALCRFSHTSPERYGKLKKTSLRLALLAALPMAVGIAVLAEPIIGLLTGDRAAEYTESVVLLRLLCAVIPLFYLNGVGQEFLYSAHRNWFVMASFATAALVSVCGNALLIPLFGVRTVAGVAIAANLSVSVLFLYALQRELGSMKLVALVLKTTVACCVMGSVAYALSSVSLAGGVLLGGVAYGFSQLLLGTLDGEERAMLRRLADGVRARFTRA